MKKIYYLLVAFMLIMIPMGVKASDSVLIAGTLLELSEQTDIYEQTGGAGNILLTLDAGTPVISAETIDLAADADAWYLVTYQDTTGYIQLHQFKQYRVEGVQEELDGVDNTNKLVIEELEYEKNQKHQKILWGSIIALLVVAIFVVGIVSAVKKNERTKGEKADETNHTDSVL